MLFCRNCLLVQAGNLIAAAVRKRRRRLQRVPRSSRRAEPTNSGEQIVAEEVIFKVDEEVFVGRPVS